MLGWAGCTVRDFILSSGFKVRIASLTENQLIIKTHSLSLSHTDRHSHILLLTCHHYFGHSDSGSVLCRSEIA